MIVETKPCPGCGIPITVEVDGNAFMRYVEGEHLQQALPDLPKEVRERFITGYCPTCWDDLWENAE